MKGYKYYVSEYMPNHVAGELVNVGVVIHSMETMRLVGKFTKNYKEIQRRTEDGISHEGVAELIRLQFLDNDFDRIESDADYLNKETKKEKGTYARWFESEIRGGIFNGKSLEDTLDKLYDYFITIDKPSGYKEKTYYLWSEDVCILNNLIYKSDAGDGLGWTPEDKVRMSNIFGEIYGDLYGGKIKVILEDKEHEKK